MNYTKYEIDQIRDTSFYCVIDYVDKLEHFHNAERNMKIERTRSLEVIGGFEK